MNHEEFEAFAEMWTETHSFMPGGKTFSPRAMTMVFEALSCYPLEVIDKAISMHVKRAKFAPTPSDIAEIINGHAPQHLTADEAWAIVAKSFDEFETVVWTKEIAEARALVSELYDSGDHIGARMAFRSAYDRIIKSAGVPVWTICAGYDKQRRIEAVTESVRIGRIPQKVLDRYLLDAPVQDAGPIAGLLTGSVVQMPSNDENLKARWHELKLAMDDGIAKAEENRRREVAEREQQRLDFERKKADALEAVKRELAAEV